MTLTTADVAAIVAIVAALPLSALLAITDTVFTQVTRARIDALADEYPDDRSVRDVRRLLEQRDQALHPVLLAELACDVSAAGLAGVVAYRAGGWLTVLAAFVLAMPVMFLVAEALPRAWALHNLDRAVRVAGPVGTLIWRLWPVRAPAALGLRISRRWQPSIDRRSIDDLGDESFVAIAGSPLEADRIDFEDQDLLASVIEFGRTVVREIMVPRPDMVALDGCLTLQQVLPMVQAEGYSRFPVTGDSIDNVVGIVYAKDIAKAALAGSIDATVAELARPAWFVPELKTVASLLREMQAAKLHVAVAVDEYGGTAGLVTMEDIIEELVGDIEDEFDEARIELEHLADGSVRLEARTPLHELNHALDIDLPEGDWDTVGGLVFDRIGAIPRVGEVIRIGSHELEVVTMRGRRIDMLLLRPGPTRAARWTERDRPGDVEPARRDDPDATVELARTEPGAGPPTAADRFPVGSDHAGPAGKGAGA